MPNARATMAILPIAGLGTRFLPATKAIPKEMMTLVDRPLIQHAIEEARAAGIERFVFVTAKGKTAMEDHFDAKPELEASLERDGKADLLNELRATSMPSGAVAYIRQNTPSGLAHAIWCARDLIGTEPCAVILPDDVFLGAKPALAELHEAWTSHPDTLSAMVAAVSVPRAAIRSYGCIDPYPTWDGSSPVMPVRGMVEKPTPEAAPSTWAVAGRYIITRSVLERIDARLKAAPAGQEVQFTDALSDQVPALSAVRLSSDRYDCGSKAGFLEANLAFGLARPEFRDRLLARMDIERKRYGA
jgi:UTP--glucose-1-phosphate uridylyltransferase